MPSSNPEEIKKQLEFLHKVGEYKVWESDLPVIKGIIENLHSLAVCEETLDRASIYYKPNIQFVGKR